MPTKIPAKKNKKTYKRTYLEFTIGSPKSPNPKGIISFPKDMLDELKGKVTDLAGNEVDFDAYKIMQPNKERKVENEK